MDIHGTVPDWRWRCEVVAFGFGDVASSPNDKFAPVQVVLRFVGRVLAEVESLATHS